jgi:tetratricopeptide (TPR) repeat protein
LIEHPGQLVRHDELLEAVWKSTHITVGTLHSSIQELRKALGDDARQPCYIETVHRRGFRFIADVDIRERREESSSTPVPVIAPAQTLHGRSDEIATLDALRTAADAGTRQTVFVTGEIGIGKTSLLRNFSQRSPQFDVAWGQSLHSYGDGEAFHPVLDAFERLCRSEADAGTQSVLRRCAPSWLLQLPSLLGPGEAESLRGQLGPVKRDRMLRELCVAIDISTRDRPLLLVLEDLHWSDPATVELIGALSERIEPARFMLLASYRPVDAALPGHPIARLHRELRQRGASRDLPLKPLSEDAAGSYLCERFDWQAPPSGLAALIQDQTDGNPLLMVTMAGYLVRENHITRREGDWRLTTPLDVLASVAPQSLREVLRHLLDTLEPDELRLLEVASCVGESFAVQALAAGLEADVDPTDNACSRLARLGQFIEEEGEAVWPDGSIGTSFEFQHAAFRRILRTMIPSGRRRGIHRRIAERMDTGYASLPDGRMAAEIAFHFEQAGEWLRAVEHLLRSAASDRLRFAHVEAAGKLRKAAKLAHNMEEGRTRDQRELEVRSELFRSVATGHGWGSAELDENLERCLELSQKLGDKRAEAFTLDRMTRRHSFRSQYDRAGASLEALRPLVRLVESPALEADVAFNAGFLALRAGELDRAADAFAESLACKVDPGEMFETILFNPQALALCASGYCAWLRGLPDDAWERVRTGVSVSKLAQEGLAAAAAQAFRAELGRFMGQPDEVRDALDQYRAELASGGIFFRSPAFYSAESWLLLEDGQVDEAIANLREGIVQVQSAGTTLWTSCLFAVLAEAFVANEDTSEGLSSIDRGLDYCRSVGEHAWEAELIRLRGELLLLRGSCEAAERSFVEALGLAHAQGARSLELRAATSLAHVARQTDPARARGVLEPILGFFDQGRQTRDLLTAAAMLESL